MALLKAGSTDDVNAEFVDKLESTLHVTADYGAEQASNTLMLAGGDPNMLSKVEERSWRLGRASWMAW